MRKFISVAIALLMVAAMLSSGALADNGNGNKGNREHRQSQGAMGNNDKGNSYGQNHTLDKSGEDDTGFADEDDGDEDEDTDENTGDVEEDDDDDNSGVMEDDDDDVGHGNGNGNKEEAPGHTKNNNKENKPDEKPLDGPNHGLAYGRVRNTLEVLDDIGLLAGEETAAQLNTLMTAYREAKDVEAAKAALTALLDALTQACTATATDESGEATDTQDQLALAEMAKLREKVLDNAGNDNGTLLALMHAYENALRAVNHLEPIEDPEDETETETDTDTGTDTGTGTESGSDTAPGI